MPRFKSLAVLCALVASPLAAQVDLPAGSPHQETAVAAARPAAQASPQLYFAARPELLNGHRLLTFEVRLNGKPYLQESVFLETAAAEGNVFEILSARPDLRARLDRLAAGSANRLEVRVSVDQEVVRQFRTWQAFLLYNQRLGAQAIAPRKAFSTVLDATGEGSGIRNLTAKGMQPDPYCMDQCYVQYDACLNGGGGGCESQYDSCVASCPIICVEPKSQTSNTTTQNWNGPYSTGNTGCYRAPWSPHAYYYYQTAMQRKHTTTTTTTNCNNQTSTSTSVSYSYQYCWVNTGMTCSFETLWSTACHY